jgi:hypothetical protein
MAGGRNQFALAAAVELAGNGRVKIAQRRNRRYRWADGRRRCDRRRRYMSRGCLQELTRRNFWRATALITFFLRLVICLSPGHSYERHGHSGDGGGIVPDPQLSDLCVSTSGLWPQSKVKVLFPLPIAYMTWLQNFCQTGY